MIVISYENFCDSADYKNFLKYKNDRIVRGFTTNQV